MKTCIAATVFVFGALTLPVLAVATSASTSGKTQDKTITKVVKLLQTMLEDSKAEGDTERVLYAKFKCYCDTNEASKKKEISDLNGEIALLESQIEEILASTAGLSKDLAGLKAAIDDLDQTVKTAKAVRKKEKEAYEATRDDLNTAIKACNESIIELATVGADQSLSVGADHKQFMAGFSLAQMQSKMKNTLVAASNIMTPSQQQTLQSFIQAPFTGTYTAQSGEVFGIIKNMRDTFMTDLAEATEVEQKAKDAHEKFLKIKADEREALVKSQSEKESDLSDNDNELPIKRGNLKTAKDAKAEAEDFLEKLSEMCATKKEEYYHRVELRTSEQAAVAKAISILNSDDAFKTFGSVKATSEGSTGPAFMQLRAEKKHIRRTSQVDRRSKAENFLRGAAGRTHSVLLSKLVAMLEVDNPFDTVLEEIKKMINIIEEEGNTDAEHLEWCNEERTVNDKKLEKKKAEIQELENEIDKLDTLINDPVTGLKALIEKTEEALRENDENQKEETATRKEELSAYNKNVDNIVEAKSLLSTAIKVLEDYYKTLEERQFSFLTKDDPTPPKTWEGDDAGQGDAGNDAVAMLKFILTETETEEENAHSVEFKAQLDYEGSMMRLTTEEATLKKELLEHQENLADAEKKLLAAKKDLERTIEEKNKIEAYLLDIKPGCDFITKNIDLRESNRAEEIAALKNAEELITDSPVYKTAVAEQFNETLDECLDFCAGDFLETAKCKACRAKVTVPAYCAGHPDTKGC